MTHHRLTFDANPKELASRDSGPVHILLLWSRRTHRAAVVVEDDASGEVIQAEVLKLENPLEIFDHPFAYAGSRGRPGRWRTGELPTAA